MPTAANHTAAPPLSWDIFCNVIDNYGDIGVCWRLARQLAHEHGATVRLWVDDLASFARLCPAVDPQRSEQRVQNIDIHHWAAAFPTVVPHQCVIEAFGCRLPDDFRASMAALRPKPVWINLEYLSAEPWIEGCHALPSPDPQLPLTKYFYFPGFVANSGGLLRESNLLTARAEFETSPTARAALLADYGLPDDEHLLISLFCYTNPALPDLLAAWANGDRPIRCLVPSGVAHAELAAFLGSDQLAVGSRWQRGQLDIRILPFVDQPAYDRLLWAADLCFVRGEDSFVRAQWAARPLIWHIYPQEEEAHLTKLDAFLDRYLADLQPASRAALRGFWHTWNADTTAPLADWPRLWQTLQEQLPSLRQHAAQWAMQQSDIPDLAASLANFCARQHASQV